MFARGNRSPEEIENSSCQYVMIADMLRDYGPSVDHLQHPKNGDSRRTRQVSSKQTCSWRSGHPEEYRQIVAYHYGMARHHLFKAQTYRDHAKARYGVQLPLFGEDDGEV
jgi:hypothetical protein